MLFNIKKRNGQIGIGNISNQKLPIQVGGVLKNKLIISVSAGNIHFCAITSEYKIYCFGYNK
jgi:alpha-tubulin suppressor-like RCC1 family protein